MNGAWEFDGPLEKVQVFGGYADYDHIEFEGPGEPGTVFANEGLKFARKPSKPLLATGEALMAFNIANVTSRLLEKKLLFRQVKPNNLRPSPSMS